jgi:hypothetical protein
MYSTELPSPSPRPSCLEASLAFLIASSGITSTQSFRRLNAIENLLTRLARPWRSGTQPLRPATELRLSAPTLDAMSQWVLVGEHDHRVATRFGEYRCAPVLDEHVRSGWIRLVLVLPHS